MTRTMCTRRKNLYKVLKSLKKHPNYSGIAVHVEDDPIAHGYHEIMEKVKQRRR